MQFSAIPGSDRNEIATPLLLFGEASMKWLFREHRAT